jgi:deoxyribodipyrimidine photo-lyase
MLSSHLHFGEISPRLIWQTVHAHLHQHPRDAGSVRKFLSEIGWREFAHHLLFYHPELPESPLDKSFSNFSWERDEDAFDAWTRGMTGYPIVDAGMRELWRTGYMHNRVRMIAASFLVKDLLLPWQRGQAWFWDTLVDADLANNATGWQWVTGSGADAAPYFRILNPVLQGERFDPEGVYVRRYVPELGELPTRFIHQPWTASPDVLSAARLRLGVDYPRPLVVHATARQRALDRRKTAQRSL